jgi:hypothetical protein
VLFNLEFTDVFGAVLGPVNRDAIAIKIRSVLALRLFSRWPSVSFSGRKNEKHINMSFGLCRLSALKSCSKLETNANAK